MSKPIHALAALPLLLMAATAQAATLSCELGDAFCTLDLPHVTLRFDAAPSGHTGVYQTRWGEASLLQDVSGTSALTPFIRGDEEGFGFKTYEAHSYSLSYPDLLTGGWKGGSDGYTSTFSLFNVSFAAKAGWQIDRLELHLTGYTWTYRNGSASIIVTPSDRHETSTDQWGVVTTHDFYNTFGGLDTGRIDFAFTTAAPREGSGGEATASMLGFTVLAQVSAVPEPANWLMLAAGGVLAAACMRRTGTA